MIKILALALLVAGIAMVLVGMGANTTWMVIGGAVFATVALFSLLAIAQQRRLAYRE